MDEAPRLEVERVGAPGLGLPAVPLPLIEVSPLDAGHQLLGPTAVVAQVGLAPAGGGDDGAVVEVVVHRRVEAVAVPVPGPQHDRVLGLVLGHQQELPGRGGGSGGGGDGGEDVLGGGVEDGLGGVDPEAVEVELGNPVDGVGDEELPHRARLGVVEVERLAPLVVVPIGEVMRGEPDGPRWL